APTAPACFYPRLRVRGDSITVAIHAPRNAFLSTPPRERRQRLRVIVADITAFLSTPPRERRLGLFILNIVTAKFLSTPPRERRRRSLARAGAHRSFYPRLRVRGDIWRI